MEERTPLTMKDIAAHFGISVATVSRASFPDTTYESNRGYYP